MDFDKIIIEYRPRLQSCQIFIKFNTNIDKNQIKLNVLPKSIIIKYEDSCNSNVDEKLLNLDLNSKECVNRKCTHIVFDTSEFFSLNSASISGLTYSGKDIIFRLQTEPKSGSFKTELLTKSNDLDSQNKKYQLTISKSTPYFFICKQCKHVLFTTNGFRRILELPSENLDMSDWFCHEDESCNNRNKSKLEPGTDDLFYKDYFVLINPELFSSGGRKHRNCPKCDCSIAIEAKNGIKIYNSSAHVRIMNTMSVSPLFCYENSVHESELQDFIFLTKKLTTNFCDTFPVPQICKIIYLTTISENKIHYLLLWIIEKSVQILTNAESFKLKLVESTKLLYRKEECGVVSAKWKAETNINNIAIEEIPYNIFKAGCRHLELMSKNVPEKYRFVNEFIMTYLDL